MPYLSDKDIKELRTKGVKVPFLKPKGKDPSILALEGIKQALSEHLKTQSGKDSEIRQEMVEILKAISEIAGKEIKVELAEERPRKWRHIIKRNREDFAVEIISEVVE